MTFTFANIKSWSAGDGREVFHAASSRAQAAQDAADGLAELPAFTTWGGESAEAAKEAIGNDMAGQITDSELHGASQRLVDLDENIVEVWADTVAVPQQPGTDTSAAANEFTQAYRDYNTEHNDVVDGLLVTCPRDA
ncbi:hypothetical protein MMUR_26240 [Mycolicibacterium murale]|uniref:Uncharacterized protein n=1 Tax=Mycolicibacterium murale TaxID=182220 RepID=A0A7I9WMB0_9MYCO|nr:hypothetical protein [Mycolicibacterium murale]MCV7185265.1 hypothetical protein [Mycolicibacterium murale]GFG58488.1 hypothetical protein MMUR_26240 [Mycolicibacterium murale]